MSSFANETLFSSGPHAFRFGPWQRRLERREFAGVNGMVILDMGLRFRKIIQTGRLQGETVEQINEIIEQIIDLCDGKEHTLVDNHGRSHEHVLLVRFETTTPIRRSRGFYCDYEIEYQQLP